jgi:hypothetical protein
MTAFDPLPPSVNLKQACQAALCDLGCKVYRAGVLVPAALGEPTAEMLQYAAKLGFTYRSPRLEQVHAERGEPCAILTNPGRQQWWLCVLAGTVKAYPNDGSQEHALHDGFTMLLRAGQEALRLTMLGTYKTADRALDDAFDALRAAEAVAEMTSAIPGTCRELWDHLAAEARWTRTEAMKRQSILDAERSAAAQAAAAKKEAHR